MHQIIFSGCGKSCVEIDVTPDINRTNKDLEPWKQSFNVPDDVDLLSFSVGTSVRVKAIKDAETNCWAFGIGRLNEEAHLPPNWRFRIYESYLLRTVCLEIISPTIPAVLLDTTTAFKTKAPKVD